MGSKAYVYKERNAPELIFDAVKDDWLLIPKNSIVFVESDLDFRLPDFIALRFNLQIQHVHRGLLLGTGPLVDPGFWGKLCIPLHNLTDEDYEIPKTEGLIWLEFTKTTLSSEKTDKARVPLKGSSKDEDGNWEIEKFLSKAASQYRGHKVPIRSSLPSMFYEANTAASKSAEDAKSAKDDAKGALEAADKFRYYNLLSMIAAAVGFVALCIAGAGFLFNLSSRNEEIANSLRTRAETAQSSINQHLIEVDRNGTGPMEGRASVASLRDIASQQQREITELKRQVDLLNAQINSLQGRSLQWRTLLQR